MPKLTMQPYPSAPTNTDAVDLGTLKVGAKFKIASQMSYARNRIYTVKRRGRVMLCQYDTGVSQNGDRVIRPYTQRHNRTVKVTPYDE